MSITDSSTISRDNLDGKRFVGTVEVNDVGLGKIIVRIPEIFGNIPAAYLPAAAIERRVQYGAADDISSLYIPDVGTKVIIQFDKGDVYSPVVVGEYIGSQSEFSKTRGIVFGDA